MATRLYAILSIKNTAKLIGVTVEDIERYHALEASEHEYISSLSPTERDHYQYSQDEDGPRNAHQFYLERQATPAFGMIGNFINNGWGRLNHHIRSQKLVPDIFKSEGDYVSGHTSNKRAIEKILKHTIARYEAAQALSLDEYGFHSHDYNLGLHCHVNALDDLGKAGLTVKDINNLYWG